MKKINPRLLFSLILITTGCTAQQLPAPTSSILPPPQIVLSPSPIAAVRTPTQAILPATTAPTAALTSSPPRTAETPTVFAYTPKPTQFPPDLNKLQVINRTNVKQLVPVWRFEPPFPVMAPYGGMSELAFSPDGNQILFVMNSQAYRMGINTPKMIQTYSLDQLFPKNKLPKLWWAIFSPDGKKVAGITEAGPVMWDANSGAPLWRADWTSYHPNGSPVIDTYTDMVFSPDSSVLVTTSMLVFGDGRIWDTLTGKLIKTFGVSYFYDAEFSPDGTCLYLVGDADYRVLYVFDTRTWTLIKTIHSQMSQVDNFHITNNGEIIAIATYDSGGGPREIEVFRLKDWTNIGAKLNRNNENEWLMPYFISTGPIFNYDGGIITYSLKDDDDKEISAIQFIDTLNLDELFTLDYQLPSMMSSLQFSPDGKLLVAQAKNGTALFYGVPVD